MADTTRELLEDALVKLNEGTKLDHREKLEAVTQAVGAACD